jgi:hypothetical protein
MRCIGPKPLTEALIKQLFSSSQVLPIMPSITPVLIIPLAAKEKSPKRVGP